MLLCSLYTGLLDMRVVVVCNGTNIAKWEEGLSFARPEFLCRYCCACL